jgi:uncharacterized protein (TIGR03437 family)
MSFRFPLLLALAGCAMAQTTTPTLTATPTSISFTWIEGAALPAAQTVSAKASNGSVAFTTAVSPGGTQWITVTPSAGNLPSSMSLLVNPSGLPIGVYTVDILVTANGFSSPLTIPVTLTVEAALPTLVLSSTSLSFSTPPNPPAAQTITLTTTGGPVTFTAAVQSAAWMTVTPTSGVVLPGFPLTLTVNVDDTGFNPSATAYAGKIEVVASGVASGAQQYVAVTMLVNALTPTITNLYPSAALVGSSALTMTITGTGFYKGTTVIAAASPTPLKSTYVNPTTMLAVLPAADMLAAGTLNVEVVNPAPGGDSTASPFTVSATPVVQAIVSAASYATGSVSPGEFVTLFGTGIGPAVPAEMSVINGYATLTLQNVSVAIDGQSAAMIYVSPNQLTVQVPYEVTIGTAKIVAVNNNGVIASGTVNTALTAPGLFSLAGNGLGQCAALVYSMTNGTFAVNGTANPAHVGDVMVLYLTGEGDYQATSGEETGFIIPSTLSPLPQLNPLPSVTIGGVTATVEYAGPVVGGLLGLLQINAVVPQGTTTGSAVPVVVTIGAGTTQIGATIVVK